MRSRSPGIRRFTTSVPSGVDVAEEHGAHRLTLLTVGTRDACRRHRAVSTEHLARTLGHRRRRLLGNDRSFGHAEQLELDVGGVRHDRPAVPTGSPAAPRRYASAIRPAVNDSAVAIVQPRFSSSTPTAYSID